MNLLRLEENHNYVNRGPISVSLEEARSWIGRRLVLKTSLLGFQPGTNCIVLCVVDFGDGFLLWITTDDDAAVEIEQMEIPLVSEYFEIPQVDSMDQSESDHTCMAITGATRGHSHQHS